MCTYLSNVWGQKLIPIYFTFSDGLTSLFTLGLLGGGLALYSPNRRKDFTGAPAGSVDRQGYYGDPYYDGYPQDALSYAQRVNQFENKVSGRLLDSLRGTMTKARKITSRYDIVPFSIDQFCYFKQIIGKFTDALV